MSKLYKCKRAAQARSRRRRKSKQIDVLKKLASAPDAAKSLQREYDVALEEHTKMLKSNRERSLSWRKKLAVDIEKGVVNALVKARGHKKAKKAYYLKIKKKGQVSALKAR